MNKDLNELIEYLDEKFQEIAKKEDLQDLSSKLVTLEEFNNFKKEINERFDGLNEGVNRLINSIDNLTKSIETYHHEQIALTAKVDRLEQWINQVAKHVGIDLAP